MRRAVWYLAAAVLAVVASALVAVPASAATAIEDGLIAALIAA